MKVDLAKDIFLNDAITSAIRQNDAMREYNKYESIIKEANKWEDVKRAAGLTTPALEGLNHIDETRKIIDVPDYMTAAVDKMNLASTIGMALPMMEEMKRTEELRKSLTAPYGITGMIQETMSLMENRPDYLYPVPDRVPAFDYAAIRPTPDPLHKVSKIFEKSESNQAEIAGHLKELVTQAKETSGQNDVMITLSKKNLIIAIVGIAIAVVFGVSGYLAGKSSSPAPQPSPAVKAVSVPVTQPVSASVPVITKK